MDFYLATGCVISALILLVGHYFPWHKLLPSGQPLDRLWSYRYGESACWVGFTYWRYFGEGDFISPLGLMIVYIVAGSVVWGAYWLDGKGQDRTIRRRRRRSDELEIVTGENTTAK
jgi:hypothetical protein